MFHSLAVQLDYDACFANLDETVGGSRHVPRVAEMSIAELAFAAGRRFTGNDLIFAAFALLPLAPFSVAWLAAGEASARLFWCAAALVALVAFVGWTWLSGVTAFYDCDRNGVSLALLALPILYMVISLAALPLVAALRFLARLFVIRA